MMINRDFFSLKSKYNYFTLIVIVFATYLYALNVNTFANHARLYPGGFTAVTLLIRRASETYFNYTPPFAIINIVLNALPGIFAYKIVGKKFTLYSLLAVVLTSIFIEFTPVYPLHNDRLIATVYGGILSGIALWLVLRIDVSFGGTEFISMIFSKKYKMNVFNYIMLFNFAILIGVGLLFTFDDALYSIIFQFISTQVVNTLYNRYKKKTVLIVTDQEEMISKMLLEKGKHGITSFKGKGMYTHNDKSMLYLVVSETELPEYINQIKTIDPDCFVNVVSSDQIYGRFYEKPFE